MSHLRIYYQFHNSLPLPAGGDRGSRWGPRIYYHFLHSLPPAGLRSHHTGHLLAPTTNFFHPTPLHNCRWSRTYYQNFNPLPRGFPRGAASLVSYANSHLLPLFALTATASSLPSLGQSASHLLPILRSTSTPRHTTRDARANARIYYQTFNSLPPSGGGPGTTWGILAPTTKHSTHYHCTYPRSKSTRGPRTYYQTFNSLPRGRPCDRV